MQEKLEVLADQIEKSVDIPALCTLAASAPALNWEPVALPEEGPALRIAVARDNAFCFYYEDNLDLLRSLKDRINSSIMLITHDLAVVSQMVDKINVMYCGKLVETGKTEDIIYHNAHPYTEGLLNSIPKLYEDRDRLDYIPGMVPNMFELPEGCYFAPRCKYCQEICRHEKPQMQEVGPGHMAACHFPLLKKIEQEEA